MKKRHHIVSRRRLRLLAVIVLPILGWVGWVEYKAGQLSDENQRVRDLAALSLEKMGVFAWPATDELIEVLMADFPAEGRDVWSDPRSHYGDALVSIGWPAARELATAVEDKRNWDRGWGIRPPGTFFTSDPRLFETLRKMRLAENWGSHRVEEALRKVMWNHDCATVRLEAARAIGIVGRSRARTARYSFSEDDLERMMESDEDPALRQWASGVAHALSHGRVGSAPPAKDFSAADYDALITRLDDDDANARAWAAWSLRTHGADIAALGLAEQTVAKLVEVLESERPDVGLGAWRALHGFLKRLPEGDPAGEKAVPLILARMRDAAKEDPKEDPHGRGMRLRAPASLLLRFGQFEQGAPLLARHIEHPENPAPDRYRTAEMLVEAAHPAGIPALIRVLDESDEAGWAAKMLGRYGPTAKEAVPRLLELLDDDRHRDTAAEALRKIDPEAAERAGAGRAGAAGEEINVSPTNETTESARRSR